MQLKRFLCVCAFSLLAGGVLPSWAAVVPKGVVLDRTQELVRGNGAEPGTLDPQKLEGRPGSRVVSDLFEGLVSQDGYGKVIPAGATDWSANKDNTEFVFHLRKESRWSDGTPVTAADYVYAFRRALDPELASPYSWYMEMLGLVNAVEVAKGDKPLEALGIKRIDDHTLKLSLSHPVAFLDKMLSHETTFPVPKHIIEKYGRDWTKPENMVSNGAYTLKEWVVNEKIVLVRNSKYWNDRQTVINKVTWLPIESEKTELTRYKAGQLHITTGVRPIARAELVSLRKTIPDEIHISPQLATSYYAFNTRKPPFNDVRVRKALSYVVDRDKITRFVIGQGEKPAYAFTPESVADYVKPDLQWANMTQEERTRRARALLKEAGYDENNPLTVTLLYNTSDMIKQLAVAISQMWKSLPGVQVSLENKEWKIYLDALHSGDFQVASSAWAGDYNEASTMLGLWLKSNGNNSTGWSHPQYEKLVKSAMTLADAGERGQSYRQAEVILAEGMPIMPLYQSVTGRLVKSFVGGYVEHNPEDRVFARNMYIIKH